MGGLFWFYVLFLAARVVGNLYLIRDPMSPLFVLIAILLVWDTLFSPFGADQRAIAAFEIVVLMFGWDLVKSHAVRAKQIRRIRQAARRALKSRIGGGPISGRPLPNHRIVRRRPPNLAVLPRPSARVAMRESESSGGSGRPAANPIKCDDANE